VKSKILLLGAGGHSKVILDSLLGDKQYEVAGIIDLKERLGEVIFNIPVLGTNEDLARFFKLGIRHCFISIGSVGDPRLRVRLYTLAKKTGIILPNIISSKALISSRISLGEGNYIAAGVIINAGAQVGNNCIINTAAIIEHDCQIGNFVHLCPGVILSGGVSVGDYSHVGTGSVTIQNVTIGKKTIIGAGSVVTKDIRGGVVAFGNPCKERKKNV